MVIFLWKIEVLKFSFILARCLIFVLKLFIINEQKQKSFFEDKVLCFSNHNEKGANMISRTMEYGWHKKKDYLGGETCWSSKWVFIDRVPSLCYTSKTDYICNGTFVLNRTSIMPIFVLLYVLDKGQYFNLEFCLHPILYPNKETERWRRVKQCMYKL